MAEPMPAPSAEGDVELARRCAAGERSAQHALFEQQRGHVHRTLFRVLGSNRHTEDLIQDTFIAVFASIASFRGESSLRTWIDTIAVRVCYRYLAQREPLAHRLLPLPDLPLKEPDAERAAQARAAIHRLYALLDRVDPKYRIAYTLHVIDGRPLKDVARVTRASLLAVKNRVWRARRRVHELALRDPLLTEFLARPRRSGGGAE
jgi:RNA polymerase sigma factor (sigma-70 family)